MKFPKIHNIFKKSVKLSQNIHIIYISGYIWQAKANYCHALIFSDILEQNNDNMGVGEMCPKNQLFGFKSDGTGFDFCYQTPPPLKTAMSSLKWFFAVFSKNTVFFEKHVL